MTQHCRRQPPSTHRRTRFLTTTTTTAAALLLLLTLPSLLSAAPASLSPTIPLPYLPLSKRAVSYVEDSDPTMELTIESEGQYYLKELKLNECFSDNKIPATYNAMMTTDSGITLNYYLDEKCEEYDFSMVSEVHEFAGQFASVKYVGLFKDAKQGIYEQRELSKTVLPEGEPKTENVLQPPTGKTPDPPAGPGGGDGDGSGNNNNGTSNPGFALGAGLVGVLVVAGIVGMGVFLYQKNKNRKRGGDGRAFMTLSNGRDDDDLEDEVGLTTGENGPHSSALMQSRAGASFEEERYPSKYRDEEHASDDDQVELGAYPQNPSGPTQYREEPGTLPQNARQP